MKNKNNSEDYITIKSIRRARLLQLIYQNGVLPDEPELISDLIESTEIDKKQKITFINNALKKLQNEGLINKIKLYHRKNDPPNYKDTYILTKKGERSLKHCANKFGLSLYRTPGVDDPPLKRNYRKYYRLACHSLKTQTHYGDNRNTIYGIGWIVYGNN